MTPHCRLDGKHDDHGRRNTSPRHYDNRGSNDDNEYSDVEYNREYQIGRPKKSKKKKKSVRDAW